MKPPVVSIVIPAYNYGMFIGEAITSLQQQTFSDFECIVVDDGSTDNSREIVQQIAGTDPRIKYVYQSNSGQPVARNAGIKIAMGTYLQFLDADDLLQSQKLAVQVKFLQENPAVSVVYGDVFYFRDSDRTDFFINRWDGPAQKWMPGAGGAGEPVVRAFVNGNMFELGCAMFRAESVADAGFFNAALQGVEDYDYGFRLALKGKLFAYLKTPATATLMRHHAASFSKSLVSMYRREMEMRMGFRKLLSLDYPHLAVINDERFQARLRQLLELLIDSRRKRKPLPGQSDLLRWIWSVASPAQRLYFFPRWVKATATGLTGAR